METRLDNLRPAGILDIAGELVTNAVFARTAESTGGFVRFAACAWVSIAGIEWLHERVSHAIGLKAALGVALVLSVPLCALPWWLMGIAGALATAAYRARLWRRAALITNGRSLLDLDGIDEVARVRYWLASGRRERVLAMGDDALPALQLLLAYAPDETVRLERAARSGTAAWEAALAAYRRGICPEIAEALVALGSPSALHALERARPRKPFIEGPASMDRLTNPVYEDLTIAIQKLAVK